MNLDPESLRWLEQPIKTDSEKKLAPTFELFSKTEIATRAYIVQNWFEQLKRLCPTGK